jgi:TM2 domain-containing membrane protein YozV
MSNEKSVFVAYALFIFAGLWGWHRFYLRRPWTGIFYFLTGGFFLIGIVWDLFAIPAMVDDENMCKCDM